MARTDLELLAHFADLISGNLTDDDEIDRAEALAREGEMRRYAGKRDRTFTYCITKRGRARLAAILVAPKRVEPGAEGMRPNAIDRDLEEALRDREIGRRENFGGWGDE